MKNNSAARLKPNCAISPATADRVILNAVCLNGRWLVEVTTIENDVVRERFLDRIEVRATEFLPFGHDCQSVRPLERCYSFLPIFSAMNRMKMLTVKQILS